MNYVAPDLNFNQLLITNRIIRIIRRLCVWIVISLELLESGSGEPTKLLAFAITESFNGRFICLHADLEGLVGVDVYTVFDVFDFDLF